MPAPTKISLLLIEDSAHDAELIELVLQRSGYQVQTTRVTDEDGIRIELTRRRFDVIISDLTLEGVSGACALERASELASETPFIFFSGVVGEAHAVEMMRLGATDYVLKQNLALLPKAVGRAVAEVYERSERRRVEAQLQTVALRSSLAIDAARMGMWDMDMATRTIVWDQRCRELLGLPTADRLPLDVYLERCHPDDREYLRHAVQKATSDPDDTEYHVQYRVLLSDGGIRWLSTRGRAVFEHGRCIGFMGVMMDITSERLATQALQEQNEKLGESIEARTRERDRTWDVSRDMLAVCFLDTRLVSLNPAWEETLGWKNDALLNRPLADFSHPDDVGPLRQLAARMAQGEVTYRFTNRMRHADGEWRWISWTAVPDGCRAYIAGRDITHDIAVVDELAAANIKLREQIEERERMEATLRQMQRMEAIGQLTAGVAHDFNNLLVVILSNAALLQRDIALQGGDALKQRVENIREAGERGAKLTGQLLAFSRRQQLEPKALNPNDTVRAMETLLQTTLGSTIRVETDLQEDAYAALADPTQLELIILNLVINARDAMPGGGLLRVTTRNRTLTDAARRPEDPEPGDYVALSVEDTGIGMTPEVLAKAFEPFFTTKDVGKGSGLGLPQVFGFAKQTGGGASIASQPGVGTVVTVYLPRLQDVQMAEQASDGGAAAERERALRTVLLVDDDNGVREVTSIMLEDLGLKVLQAASGQEALKIIHADTPIDILLTDFAMPGMNGAELAQAVRERLPTLPVVFVTGYAELDAFDLDNAQVLQKPFRERELAERIARAHSACPEGGTCLASRSTGLVD